MQGSENGRVVTIECSKVKLMKSKLSQFELNQNCFHSIPISTSLDNREKTQLQFLTDSQNHTHILPLLLRMIFLFLFTVSLSFVSD